MNENILQKHKYFVLLSVPIMISVYFVPLWIIIMGGVQFPDPLEMLLYVYDIVGGEEWDIYTINDFNHYVGMGKINAEAMPELKYMPWILGYIILFSVITFFHSKVYMVLIQLAHLTLAGLAGMVDFYLWLYKYGKNMDTTAPLYNKVFDYQPPLFACKQIMNVRPCSWPHIGTFIMLGVAGIFIYIAYKERELHLKK